MIEILSEAAFKTYLDAGGRLLGQPGTPFEYLGVDYMAAWRKVAQVVKRHVDDESEVTVKNLAEELSNAFYERVAGTFVFKEFARQALSEQIAWEAVGRAVFQLAAVQEDDDEAAETINWSEWAKRQHQQRIPREQLQNA